MPELIAGKKLLFVDDSIVRGTQLRETVDFLYNSGAREVHMRSACPPIMFGCKYLSFSRSNSDYELIKLMGNGVKPEKICRIHKGRGVKEAQRGDHRREPGYYPGRETAERRGQGTGKSTAPEDSQRSIWVRLRLLMLS